MMASAGGEPNQVDVAAVIADFGRKGIELVAIAESFVRSSQYGRAERTRSALHVKRLGGERISGHAPFGWDFGTGGLLVENAGEQQNIARMRRLQADGLSFRGIAVRLDKEGIRPKRGKRWIHTTVKSILARNAA
jgi:hypothetical protein